MRNVPAGKFLTDSRNILKKISSAWTPLTVNRYGHRRRGLVPVRRPRSFTVQPEAAARSHISPQWPGVLRAGYMFMATGQLAVTNWPAGARVVSPCPRRPRAERLPRSAPPPRCVPRGCHVLETHGCHIPPHGCHIPPHGCHHHWPPPAHEAAPLCCHHPPGADMVVCAGAQPPSTGEAEGRPRVARPVGLRWPSAVLRQSAGRQARLCQAPFC